MTRRKVPQLDLTVEFVTPEMAVEWLTHNTHNRKVSKRLVGIYAEAIIEDEWVLNGEPIIFDSKGVLQSGQHRLLAVIEAGQGIWTVVVRGAHPEGLYSLDSNRRRRIADVLYLRGESDVNNLGSALQWLWRVLNNAMDRQGETATNSHLLKLLDEYPEIRDHLIVGRQVRKATGYSIGLVAALHWRACQIDPEDATAFFDQIVEGLNMVETDPVYVLRRWAEIKRHSKPRPSNTVYAAIVIKAWNAWRDHREVKALSFHGRESFPEMT